MAHHAPAERPDRSGREGGADGGAFGRWSTDRHGLPRFELADGLSATPDLVLPDGGGGDGASQIWHQVGNDVVTATAHAGGWITLYSSEAGLVRLSDSTRAAGSLEGSLGGVWRIEDLEGRSVLSTSDPPDRTVWHPGGAEWRWSGPELTVRRRVLAPFGDVPALVVHTSLRSRAGTRRRAGRLVEEWGFSPRPIVLGGLMSRSVPPPSGHPLHLRLLWRLIYAGTNTSRILTEGVRSILGARLALTPVMRHDLGAVLLRAEGDAAETPRRPTPLARIPGAVFVAPVDAPGATAETATVGKRARVRWYTPLVGDAPETTRSFAVGIAPVDEIGDALDAIRVSTEEGTAEAWSRVWAFDSQDAGLRRESLWHAAMLRSAQVRDTVMGGSYVPQGSAYGFLHGLQGAPRDYAMTLAPLVHVHPEGAREMLRLALRMADPDGTVRYAHTGAGWCTSAGIHPAPSDLPIALLWAVTEVVWATGDRAILDLELPFRPRRGRRPPVGTVRDRVLLLWERIRDGVGIGHHGLLRVGSGDWNDPISAMAPDRRAFHRHGESTYNTAFAAYVLPRVATLLRPDSPDTADEILAFASGLQRALADCWTGRWFVRGYDGRTLSDSRATAIGAEHLFLDANAWCLIAGAGDRSMRGRLVGEIADRCDRPSPIGATALDDPMRVRGGILAPGWDTNGGVWAALNAFLAWGYALHDPDLAWACLRSQTLAAHARAYPNVWFGIWSGPDAYNAHDADRPGETFVQPVTPMQEYPVMNSNAHAGPLLALLKILGVDAGPDGFSITPHVPGSAGPWRLRTALVDAEGHGPTGTIHRH